MEEESDLSRVSRGFGLPPFLSNCGSRYWEKNVPGSQKSRCGKKAIGRRKKKLYSGEELGAEDHEGRRPIWKREF